MNDNDPIDGLDSHLGDRMERAVGGLRAPDVTSLAVARGRRQRTRRRVAHGAGSLAAVTALALTVPAFVGGDQAPSEAQVAADPAATSPSAAPVTDSGVSGTNSCGTQNGWWSKSTAQIRAELADLLPEGTAVGTTNDDVGGMWGGNLVTGEDADYASLTLLPPPGVPGPAASPDTRLADLTPSCSGGGNEPSQAVKPCAELTAVTDCEEIRSEDDQLVGVVTEHVEQSIVDGQEQPTDQTYVQATLTGPEGGHVELYVAEGTRADRPDTVRDPADVPALSVGQVRDIVTASFWTSPVTAEPATTSPPAAADDDGGAAAAANETCDGVETGWWTKSPAQIDGDLSALLPAGTRTGRSDESVTGLWDGTLVTGDDTTGAELTLLPPPGVLGPLRSLAEVSRLGPCGGGANKPAAPVKPCDEVLSGTGRSSEERANVVSCEEIRSESGELVGVVTQQDQPADQVYFVAVAAAPGGGHVQLVVGDVLSADQVRDIVTDPVWTS